MSQTKNLIAKDSTIGDSAVDGLLAGLGAGTVMAIYLVAAGAIGGDSPAFVLSRFDPGGTAPVTGALMHLAVGSVYGMVFLASLSVPSPKSSPVLAARCDVWTRLAAARRSGHSPGREFAAARDPGLELWRSCILYGATLGLLIGRAEENSKGQVR